MQVMTSARSNVRKTLDELTARHQRLRQEQITEELLELSRPVDARFSPSLNLDVGTSAKPRNP
jgi:hypothetical protein